MSSVAAVIITSRPNKLAPSDPNIELGDDGRTESPLSVLVLFIELHISTRIFFFFFLDLCLI